MEDGGVRVLDQLCGGTCPAASSKGWRQVVGKRGTIVVGEMRDNGDDGDNGNTGDAGDVGDEGQRRDRSNSEAELAY